MDTFLDFDLLIERTSAGGYRARVINSPAGQPSGEFTLPFSEMELENFLLKIGRPRRGVRKLESPEMDAAKVFGGSLFKAVFSDDVLACLRSSMDEATAREAGLRLRLRLTDAPELADLPWEYLYNPSLNRFLALSVQTPIVRYLDIPERIRPLQIKPPLRILALITSPSDYPPLDVEHEWANLQNALSDLQQRGLVQLHRLEASTPAALQRALGHSEYHIFHFIGHGGFDAGAQEGVILLEDDAKRGRTLSGEALGTLLHDETTLRLAVLNACEGARSSRSDPFAGVAQSLVQQGLPAVIAMQFEVSDKAAITFSHEFYNALAEGKPIDTALGVARKAIYSQENDIEWATPVLYLRALDGVIFNVEQLNATAADLGAVKPASLTIYEGSQAVKTFPLAAGATILGRDKEANIQLSDSLVSRRHAQIFAAAGEYLIEDLASAHGLFVNGERLSGRRSLQHGDRLKMGATEFTFEIKEQPASALAPERSLAMPAPASPAGAPPPPAAPAPAAAAAPGGDFMTKLRALPVWVWAVAGLAVLALFAGILLSRGGASAVPQTSTATQPLPIVAQVSTTTPTSTSTIEPSSTSTTEPTDQPTIEPTITPTPEPGVIPTADPSCDRASYVADISYSDGSQVIAGSTFVKTWRLRNNGACTWDAGYALVFDSGDKMGGPAIQQLTNSTVKHGGIIDISVSLQAPSQPGAYKGNWMLRNSVGAVFGIGQDGDTAFWVSINAIDAEALPPTPPPSTPTAEPTATPLPLPAQITDDSGSLMALIPAGSFKMGSKSGEADESPAHNVTLPDYYFDVFEVTNEQYAACVNDDACKPPTNTGSATQNQYYSGGPYTHYPVIYVSWEMAQNYCEWRGARLPTEAEWEKAARGDGDSLYPWGDNISCSLANYRSCGVNDTGPVDYFASGLSPYGIYGLAGNVMEWVADWYDAAYYASSLGDNPSGPASGQFRVVRGGAFSSDASFLRVTDRDRKAPTTIFAYVGFRCARNP